MPSDCQSDCCASNQIESRARREQYKELYEAQRTVRDNQLQVQRSHNLDFSHNLDHLTETQLFTIFRTIFDQIVHLEDPELLEHHRVPVYDHLAAPYLERAEYRIAQLPWSSLELPTTPRPISFAPLQSHARNAEEQAKGIYVTSRETFGVVAKDHAAIIGSHPDPKRHLARFMCLHTMRRMGHATQEPSDDLLLKAEAHIEEAVADLDRESRAAVICDLLAHYAYSSVSFGGTIQINTYKATAAECAYTAYLQFAAYAYGPHISEETTKLLSSMKGYAGKLRQHIDGGVNGFAHFAGFGSRSSQYLQRYKAGADESHVLLGQQMQQDFFHCVGEPDLSDEAHCQLEAQNCMFKQIQVLHNRLAELNRVGQS